jgi:hypothetical protein
LNDLICRVLLGQFLVNASNGKVPRYSILAIAAKVDPSQLAFCADQVLPDPRLNHGSPACAQVAGFWKIPQFGTIGGWPACCKVPEG